MRTVNVYAAKTQLSRLIDEAAAGQEIILAKAGKPMAKLVSLGRPKRRFGLLAGQLRVPHDFDAPMPEKDLAIFQGERAPR